MGREDSDAPLAQTLRGHLQQRCALLAWRLASRGSVAGHPATSHGKTTPWAPGPFSTQRSWRVTWTWKLQAGGGKLAYAFIPQEGVTGTQGLAVQGLGTAGSVRGGGKEQRAPDQVLSLEMLCIHCTLFPRD